MTRDTSLREWERVGIFDRETALYRRLVERGAEVSMVTYGGPGERDYASRLPGIRILCNRWHLPMRRYRQLIPWIHERWLRRGNVFKSNQIHGSYTACRAARKWGKPVIVRCGFLPSDFLSHDDRPEGDAARIACEMEKEVFTAAQRIVVTTQAMADDVARRLPACKTKMMILPNYVDTDQFRPLPESEKDIDLLFIGRLAEQKNIEGLLAAVAPLDMTLTIVGDGPQREMVDHACTARGDRVRWIKRLENRNIPALMGRAKVFVQPSRWEGHPKTLIEAMACGLPVIGADSPGISTTLRHGDTGWLCGIEPEKIREAIAQLAGSPDLRAKLGSSARSHAVATFSLDMIAEREWILMRELVRH